jgi:hypothetical protein
VHLALSLGLAALQYWRTRGLLPAAAPLVSGFLVDADHLVDYLLYHRTRAKHAELARRRLVLPLRGWEYLLLAIGFESLALRGRASTAYGLTLGYLVHLLVDQLDNELLQPLAYSLLYRASRRFEGPFFRPNEARAWRRESALRTRF